MAEAIPKTNILTTQPRLVLSWCTKISRFISQLKTYIWTFLLTNFCLVFFLLHAIKCLSIIQKNFLNKIMFSFFRLKISTEKTIFVRNKTLVGWALSTFVNDDECSQEKVIKHQNFLCCHSYLYSAILDDMSKLVWY